MLKHLIQSTWIKILQGLPTSVVDAVITNFDVNTCYLILDTHDNSSYLQEQEIRRLLEINKTLNNRIKHQENRITKMEDALQVR